MLKKILLFTFLFFAILSFVNCDSNVTEISPDADVDYSLYSITLGALYGNSVYVHVPVEIFGGESALNDTPGIDIYQNGKFIGGVVSVASLYDQGSGLIIFRIGSVSVSDTIGFVVYTANGSYVYYEGNVSDDGESYASLSVVDFDISNPGLGEVGTLFWEKTTTQGDATGSELSGTYAVTFDGFSYSEDCTVDFIKAAQFYYDKNLDDDELAQVITTGTDSFETNVIITQSDADIIWDDVGSYTGDYAGVIFDGGTYEFFKGDYVNENNYRYTLIQGVLSDGVLMGDFYATITLDGQKLLTSLQGSCTVWGSFASSVD